MLHCAALFLHRRDGMDGWFDWCQPTCRNNPWSRYNNTVGSSTYLHQFQPKLCTCTALHTAHCRAAWSWSHAMPCHAPAPRQHYTVLNLTGLDCPYNIYIYYWLDRQIFQRDREYTYYITSAGWKMLKIIEEKGMHSTECSIHPSPIINHTWLTTSSLSFLSFFHYPYLLPSLCTPVVRYCSLQLKVHTYIRVLSLLTFNFSLCMLHAACCNSKVS